MSSIYLPKDIPNFENILYLKMRINFFVILIFLFGSDSIVYGQPSQLQFNIFDNSSRQPVSSANVFFINTTFGSISNHEGIVLIDLPQNLSEGLLISHIGYDTRILQYQEYIKLTSQDTIFLFPSSVDISEITIKSKRSNKWKKNVKKFTKAFLGDSKAAGKCKIINPEVLRFKEENKQLLATAIDLIKIENRYLGYNIAYQLSHLKIEDDGSLEYLGRAFYTDVNTENPDKDIIKNREKIYQNSPKHFFKNLIENRLKEEGYEVQIVSLKNNQFEFQRTPEFLDLIEKSPDSINNHLLFDDFLKITNRNNVDINFKKAIVMRGGRGSSRGQESARVNHAVSYIYKIAPFLVLNKYGNVLNTKKVKEYGYWADLRFADQLPFNYGDEYIFEKKEENTAKVQISQMVETSEISENEKFSLLSSIIYNRDIRDRKNKLMELSQRWDSSFLAPIIELTRMSSDQSLIKDLNILLQNKTGEKGISDYYEWLKWLWNKQESSEKYYADFKGDIYKNIDSRFRKYFYGRGDSSLIRMDEIVWGGVKQDGIPPLRYPKLLSSEEADYLDGDDIVFGIYINGVAHAYPKRILAWHEFVVDEIGGETVAGVYCTLCGTVIVYNMNHHGKFYNLGTSGFLFRSNKLMYDQATQSLWSTIDGKPVVGPLINKGIELNTLPVVTTSWKEWQNDHPDTKVLSLETGHRRNYNEGEAYKEYYASDQLMFPVPLVDSRLKNKEEVFIIRAPEYQEFPLAISIKYLKSKRLYQGAIGETQFVVLTEKNGESKVYSAGDFDFKSYKKGKLKDSEDNSWEITAEYLYLSENVKLERIPAHNIFWFAWYNMYPNTRLID